MNINSKISTFLIAMGLVPSTTLYAQDAEFLQAINYEQGKDVPKNVVKAAEFYLKAQEKSHPVAANALERMYFSELKEKNFSSFKSAKEFQSIIDWAEKSRTHRLVSVGVGGAWNHVYDTMWEKKGTTYVSQMFGTKCRFRADDFDAEEYSQPFQGMLNGPKGRFSISVTPNEIIIRNVDKIQLNGGSRQPTDYAAMRFGCKTGIHKGTAYMDLLGGSITVPYTISCQHSSHHTSRYDIEGGDGGTVIGRVKLPSGRTQKTAFDDPFAPWQQSHDQKATFNLNEIAKLNHISKKELVARILLTEKWKLPILVPNEKNKPAFSGVYGNLTTYIFDSDYNITEVWGEDQIVLIYFLWKQFGITVDYLHEVMKELIKEPQELTKIYKSSVALEKKRLEQVLEKEKNMLMEGIRASFSSEQQHSIEKAKQQGVEFVDLGLNTLWANSNMGTENQGYFYAWGDPVAVKENGNEKKKYKPLMKAKKGAELDANSDPATIILGSAWCVPSKTQWEELISSCAFTVMPNSNNILVTGPNGNSIVFKSDGTQYWTRNAYTEYNGWATCARLFFTKKDNEINKYCWESSANSLCLIRPVIKNNKTIDRSAFNAAKEKLERYTEVHSKFLQ